MAIILLELETKVATANGPATYTDDFFTITLFPLSQMQELQTWLTAQDRRKGFNGVALNYDDTERVAGNKIRDKAKQLPADGAGIIFIPLSWQHFWHQQVSKTIGRFQSRMADLPHVLGVFIFSEIIHVDAETFRFNSDDAFDRTAIADALTMYSLFVGNPAFNRPINPATVKKIIRVLAPGTGGSGR